MRLVLSARFLKSLSSSPRHILHGLDGIDSSLSRLSAKLELSLQFVLKLVPKKQSWKREISPSATFRNKQVYLYRTVVRELRGRWNWECGKWFGCCSFYIWVPFCSPKTYKMRTLSLVEETSAAVRVLLMNEWSSKKSFLNC